MGKFFKTYSEREVKRVMPIIQKINSLEEEISKLSDEELRGKLELLESDSKKTTFRITLPLD